MPVQSITTKSTVTIACILKLNIIDRQRKWIRYIQKSKLIFTLAYGRIQALVILHNTERFSVYDDLKKG